MSPTCKLIVLFSVLLPTSAFAMGGEEYVLGYILAAWLALLILLFGLAAFIALARSPRDRKFAVLALVTGLLALYIFPEFFCDNYYIKRCGRNEPLLFSIIFIVTTSIISACLWIITSIASIYLWAVTKLTSSAENQSRGSNKIRTERSPIKSNNTDNLIYIKALQDRGFTVKVLGFEKWSVTKSEGEIVDQICSSKELAYYAQHFMRTGSKNV